MVNQEFLDQLREALIALGVPVPCKVGQFNPIDKLETTFTVKFENPFSYKYITVSGLEHYPPDQPEILIQVIARQLAASYKLDHPPMEEE